MLFARYAFGPNRFGLCGPDDWQALSDAASADAARAPEANAALRRLALDFEGALPYLQLIAAANGMADPLDARVVDAYWIGNSLSDRVSPGLLAESLDQRFRARLRCDDWRWLASKPTTGAKPTHAFHVLDVFTRVGLMRGGAAADTIGLMDACRIRWGRVVGSSGMTVTVEVRPLTMLAGKLVLGPPRVEAVQAWLGGEFGTDAAAPGDFVSIHWGWLCEVLSPARAQALAAQTLTQLSISNQTI